MSKFGSKLGPDHDAADFAALDADLDDEIRERSGTAKRVCIATPDILGPVKNGGIGTAYHHLARLLAEWGHEVVIAYVNGNAAGERIMEESRAFYSQFDVAFEPIIPRPVAKTVLARVSAPTWALYDWLRTREQPFDIVHVSDWHGLGYGPLLAKSLGLTFGATHFVIHGHGPTLWNVEGNQQLLSQERELGWVFMERRSVELADTVTCGSAHLLKWMHEAGYALPARSFVWSNPFPSPDTTSVAEAERAARDGAQLEEVVFFGRLEPRKGLILFVDAIDRLVRQNRAPARVTFLGGSASRFDGPGFIRHSARDWPIEFGVITDFGAEEAVAYLSKPGRLAVLPSLQENSSLAVTECLHAGIPFIAAATGGTPELIAPEDCDSTLFAPDHIVLGNRIAALVGASLRAVQPRWDFERSLEVWSRWHTQLVPFEATAYQFANKEHAANSETPLVTVCIVHHERTELVRMAIDSVLAQDYPKLEAVLIDDGSQSAAALLALDALESEFGGRGWRVIRQENRYLGAARNTAAAVARGEWLLFLDDDNVLFPDAISLLLRAARFSGADCVPAASIRFTGDGDPRIDTGSHGTPIRFLGAARAWSRFNNVVGDSCALVRRDAYEAVGGFTEEYRVGLDDLSFLNRLIQTGHRVEPMPDPVYYYRFGKTSMKSRNRLAEAAQVRVLAPHLEGLKDEERAYEAYAAVNIRNAVNLAAHPAASQPRVMALARQKSRLGIVRLQISILLNPAWVESVRRRLGRTAALELRRNGRVVATVRVCDAIGNVLRIGAGLSVLSIGGALYSIHEAISGEVIATLFSPSWWRARRVVGAVENRPRLEVRGWVFDRNAPGHSRKVAIHVDGCLRQIVNAANGRADIARSKMTGGPHGFFWRIPEGLAPEDGTRIDVFDADTGQALYGSPLRIENGHVVAGGRRRR